MLLHASCVSTGGRGLLLLGPSGAGKSDLALRLIGRGFVLVADDQVVIVAGRASPPPRLAGLLEIRGVGLLRFPHLADIRLALALALGGRTERLPPPAAASDVPGVPLLPFDPWEVSAADKAAAALAAAAGDTGSEAGAFA